MSNIDNIVDMTIKRVHTNNKMNSVTDNSRLINELQLQEEPVRLSSRELFKTSKFYRIVLIINMIVIVIAMLIAAFGSIEYKTHVNRCFPEGLPRSSLLLNTMQYDGACNKSDFKEINKYNDVTYRIPFFILFCLLGIDFVLIVIGFFVDRQSFSKLLSYFLILFLLVAIAYIPMNFRYIKNQIDVNIYYMKGNN